MAVLLGLLTVVLGAMISIRVLAEMDWDPSVFVAFGEESLATREYAEDRLGNVFLRQMQGHDGRFFFIQANDPWITDPETHASVLDRPLYRSQRMLYPVLAGGAGLFSPETIVWSMLVVNLIALGIGTWITALIAIEMGGSPWWGLAFTLNLGFVSEIVISGAGVVAAAAAFGSVLMFMRDRVPFGVALLALAALSREAMLIAAAGTAIWLWTAKRRREAVASALAPGLVVIAWGLYLRLRIGEGSVVDEVQEVGWPFVGFFDSFHTWIGRPADLVTGIAIIVLFLLYTRRVLMGRHLVGWAFLGFVLLGIIFTEQVWRSLFDISRAVAPIITSFVLLVFLGSKTKHPSEPALSSLS